ncbi:ATPase, AFG1 family protein [Cardiosporidium cionae]|uniref:ATPase, AFG1 family protein n=1 Tax=Cardiosporidium cionae TaxID=476202 RepID=A0ABQ7JB20_9APIC|nr:ATPase, AFG1 family protein [Cardiosporidium cionae]|eukprot:KAF8821207.1 ATPase, AFG1 family protein [Cardiosporidium cionae]
MEVAKEIHQRAVVLCFDEFQVVHITDAMILKRLFEGLFMLGTVVVSTSNRPPIDLYKNGLNRRRFLPFIQLLQQYCDVYQIETKKDFRLGKIISSNLGMYHVPSRSTEEILKHVYYLCKETPIKDKYISVSANRKLLVPYSVDGIAIFRFSNLCETAVGTPDFLALADNFHTIFIYEIPGLQTMDTLYNEIRRFINLMDVLYERQVRVIFDVRFPLFQLFGNLKIIENFERMKNTLLKKFDYLEDALLFLVKYSNTREALTEESFIEAFQDIGDISPNISQQIFHSLTHSPEETLPVKALRSALFYHQKHYDFSPPTVMDPFLFGQKSNEHPIHLDALHYRYELYNENDTSSADDIKFSYLRTLSRIRDMISLSYLEAHQAKHKLNDLSSVGIH